MQQPSVPKPKIIATPTTVARPQFPKPLPKQGTQIATPNFPKPLPKQGTQIAAPNVPRQTIVPTPGPMATKPITAPGPPKQTTQGGMLSKFGGGTAKVTTMATTPLQTKTGPKVTIAENTGYSTLMNLSPVWNGTAEKAQQLANLRYQNGNVIIDVRRKDVINEIIGMLKTESFEDVIKFLQQAPNADYVLWEQKSLDEGRNKINREIIIQQSEDVGVKGVGKCRYCPSTELVFAQKQLRGGDEPMTIFVRCVLCNKQWRQ